MTDILTRLRDATEGSRKLDQIIGEALKLPPRYPSESSLCIYAHYTTSIDTALTLVPEGWKPSMMSWSVPELTEPTARVSMFMTLVSNDYKGHVRGEVKMHEGATPAIAVCIAALKARMAKEDAA